VKVELRYDPLYGWVALLDRQATFDEGPRRVGECVYCAGPCENALLGCAQRVYQDRLRRFG
jgi:hypothetical protein